MKHALKLYPPSRLRALVLLFAATTAGPAMALPTPSLGLDNPAVAQAYVGPATFEKLSAAMAGLRPLLNELPLILPPGGCWFCGSSGSVIIRTGDSIPIQDLMIPGHAPTLLFAGSDADLGGPGAAVTLAFARLRLTGSFETGRDFIIGHPDYAPDYHPGWLTIVYTEGETPPPVGGPGWIDTDGHDLKITGRLTSWQRLYKEGEGRLWLTGANVWHTVPEVKAGVLQGDTVSLATDIVNRGQVSFAQAVDGGYDYVISGTGGLDKTGAGVLSLSRAQTYTGPTRILEGTLALAGGRIEASTSVEVAAGALLDTAGTHSTALRNLSGEGRVRFAHSELTLRNDTDTSFAGQIEGDNELVVTGSSTLTLTGTNNHQGTRISRGHLAIGHDASLGAAGTPLTIQDGGRLILLADLATDRSLRAGHGTSTLDTGGHDLTLRSPLEGHGYSLTKQGDGSLILTAAATYRGEVTVAAGTLALVGRGALDPATAVMIAAGTLDLAHADGDRQLRSLRGDAGAEVRLGANTLILAGGWGSFSGGIRGEGGLNLDGAHSFQELTGVNTYTGPTTVLAGTLRARPHSLSERVVNHGRLELFDVGTLDDISAYSGDITGSGELVKTDRSVIWLRGRNDYTGGTRILAGVLMGNTDSLPGDFETEAGLAFYQVEDGTFAGRVRGSGTLLSFGPGALTLVGDNVHTGGTAFSNTLRIQRDANLGGPGSGLLIAGGTLVALDDLVLDRHVALGTAGARFDSNGHDIRLNGLINGPGGVTKLGEGVLYLAGRHGYADATRVEAGGMRVNGRLAGDVAVLPGAWMEILGEVGGDLHLAEAATLSAGNSPGTLRIEGDLIAAGEIRFEIAGPELYDRILVDGLADLGQATLSFVLLDDIVLPADLSSYRFLQAAGGVTGLEGVQYRFGPGLDGYTAVWNGNQLTLAPVPEPETWALMLAGLGLVGWMARRRSA